MLVAALLLISFSETIAAATLCHVESTDIDYLVGFAIISDFDTYSEILESGDFDGAYEFLYENIDYGYATEFEYGEDVYIVDSDDDATKVRRPSEADWSWCTYSHAVVCPNSVVSPIEKKFLDIGPYNVSFDMGTIGEYTVEANQSWLAEGKLNLHIISGDDTAIIFGYPDLMGDYASEDSQKNRLDEDFYENGVKPDYYRRTIDGQDGLLGVVGDGDFFEALYSKEVNGYGNILIKIISTFPWNKGTENLLKTIKMEYTPNSASNNGMQYTGHQAGLMEEWERTYSPPHHCCDYLIRSASQTKDGGHIIAGLTENATYGKNYGYDAVLIKAGSDGREEWNKTFEGAVIYSILQANDGDYIIAGAKGIEGQ